jgi:hypothetical protein
MCSISNVFSLDRMCGHPLLLPTIRIRTRCLFFSFFLNPLPLSLTHVHTHTLSLTYTYTLTRTHIHTHTHQSLQRPVSARIPSASPDMHPLPQPRRPLSARGVGGGVKSTQDAKGYLTKGSSSRTGIHVGYPGTGVSGVPQVCLLS